MGFLFGLKRGFKKSLFRFIWLGVTVILLLIFSAMITKALIHMDVSFLNLTVAGEPVTSLYEYMKLFIEGNEAVQTYISNPAVLSDLAESIPVLFANVIIFVLLFWLTKIILWPLWAIFASKIGRKEKLALKRHEITIATNKKRPWLGGLIGVFSGIMIAMVTFMPVIGLSSTLIEIDNSNLAAAAETADPEPSLLTELLGEEAVQYLYRYENSPIGKVFKYTGVNAMGTAMFNNVSSVKVNGETISLTKEAKGAVRIYNNAKKISKIKFDNLTEDDIAVLLDSMKDIVKDSFGSGVVKSLFDELMPNAIDSILTDPDYEIKIPDTGIVAVNEGIEDILLAVKELNATKMCQDAIKLIEVLELMNDEHLIIQIYNEDLDAAQSLIRNIRSDFAADVVDKFFEMNTTSSLAPIIIKTGVKTACELLDVTYVDLSNENTLTALNNMFTEVLDNALIVLGNVDKDEAPYISTENISNIGAIFDAVLNGDLMHDTTFANLKAKAQEKADEALEGEIDDQTLLDVAKTAVTDIFSLIGDDTFSFESDFTIFENVIVSFLDYRDAQLLIDPDTKEYKYSLSKYGEWLDLLSDAKLFNVAYDNLLDGGFTYACTFEEESGLDISELSFLINSLKNITSSTSTNEWRTELTKLQPLKDEIMELTDSTLVPDLLVELKTTTRLADIGAILDDLIDANSIILSESNIEDLLKFAINEAPLPQEILDITFTEGTDTLTFVEKIQANIDTIESYETELGYVKQVITMIDDLGSLTHAEVGEILDDLRPSKLMAGVIDKILEVLIDESVDELEDQDIKDI
ncbi:MAG: hypothetical protein PHY08_14200, partial [Candidatus Cloacimonetes bacterium]|nr:hypothetical protein [Candidatus Cloacimonadota bacterium]